MGKIIRLTEADLTRLVNRVIKEQSKVMTDRVSSSSSKGFNMIDTCASMGVKTPGYCDTQGKKPVKSCASLGVKTPGFCYVDTKKPIPNQAPKGKDSIKEQVLQGLSSGNSAKAVADIFRSCSAVKPSTDSRVKQATDSIYRAIQGLGTNEQAIMQAFSTLRSKNEFCGVNKMYLQTYGTNLYTDLDGDIDQEPVWANISRILRNLQIDPKVGAVQQKTGPGAKPTPASTAITAAKKQLKDVRSQNLAARQQGVTTTTKQQQKNTRVQNLAATRQQAAGGVRPTNPTSRMPVR